MECALEMGREGEGSPRNKLSRVEFRKPQAWILAARNERWAAAEHREMST